MDDPLKSAKRFPAFSIRTEISFLLILGTLGVGIMQAWWVPSEAAQGELLALRQRAHGTALMIAEIVSAPIEFIQLHAVEEGLRVALTDGTVEWVTAYDTEGHQLGIVGKPKVELETLAEAHTAVNAQTDVVSEVPIIASDDSQIGTVLVALKTTSIDARKAATQWKILVHAGLLSLAALFYGVFFATRMTLPMRHITTAARCISKGDVAEELVLPKPRNELGIMALSFELMNARLRQLQEQATLVASGDFSDADLGAGALFQSFKTMIHRLRESKAVDELRQQELSSALEQAEAANLAKNQFLANMSHEIRTPLNGISGFAEALTDQPLTSQQKEYVDLILQSNTKLVTIINDILDFSKIEAGSLTVEAIEFDLAHCIEDCLQLFGQRFAVKELELIHVIHAPVPKRILGDPSRLQQILNNLIGNAFKFTSSGLVSLDVSLKSEQDGQGLLLFEVRDTGVGIGENLLDMLFEPFMQADASTTRKFGGTGLGLTISRQLAVLMGGDIGVMSEPGVGSCFWFTIRTPLLATSERFEAVPSPAVDSANGYILIASKSTPLRAILANYVRIANFSPIEVHSQSTLQESLKKYTFHRLLLDMSIAPPQELVQIAGKRPYILLAPTHVKISSVPPKRVLRKPFRYEELLRCLNEDVLASSGTNLADEELGPASEIPIHILVADDNPINQRVAATALRKAGYQVDVVEDGSAAFLAVQNTQYDLILMDCLMPEMDGYESTENIRKWEKGKTRVPIVAVTANAMRGDREKCIAAGMDDFLSKPYRRQDLLDIIKRWHSST
ncbi:MAG: response regulator [Myxococcales bacterium]|nr:response regulator [Myxococcales bacterium]